MDNTPTEEAEDLNKSVRMPSIIEKFILQNNLRHMFKAISRGASHCDKSGNGEHRFEGYPRSKARCKWCHTPRNKE